LLFSKFIHRIRLRFSQLFDELLKKQLLLKGIISEEDWDDMKEMIFYDFTNDNHFSELKQLEILQARVQMLDQIDPYIGRFFDETYVKENILKQNEVEREEIEKGIKKDASEEGPDDDMVKIPLDPDTRIVSIPKDDLPNFVPGASKEDAEVNQIKQDTEKTEVETDKLEKGEDMTPETDNVDKPEKDTTEEESENES
jgi:hypothetical protein